MVDVLAYGKKTKNSKIQSKKPGDGFLWSCMRQESLPSLLHFSNGVSRKLHFVQALVEAHLVFRATLWKRWDLRGLKGWENYLQKKTSAICHRQSIGYNIILTVVEFWSFGPTHWKKKHPKNWRHLWFFAWYFSRAASASTISSASSSASLASPHSDRRPRFTQTVEYQFGKSCGNIKWIVLPYKNS